MFFEPRDVRPEFSFETFLLQANSITSCLPQYFYTFPFLVLTALFESLAIHCRSPQQPAPHLSWLPCLLLLTSLPADQYWNFQLCTMIPSLLTWFTHGGLLGKGGVTNWDKLFKWLQNEQAQSIEFRWAWEECGWAGQSDSTGESVSPSGVWNIRGHRVNSLFCACTRFN